MQRLIYNSGNLHFVHVFAKCKSDGGCLHSINVEAFFLLNLRGDTILTFIFLQPHIVHPTLAVTCLRSFYEGFVRELSLLY
jgi:hypothetical protein